MTKKLKYTIYFLTAKKPVNSKSWMRRALKRLMRKDKNICSYCGKPIIRNEGGGKTKKMHATLDHVYGNLDIRRFLAEREVVLSCFKCNINKGKSDFKKVFCVDGYQEKHDYPNILINLLK